MKRWCASVVLSIGVLAMSVAGTAEAAPVRVGSKAFTESVILGEMMTHLLKDAGLEVEHRRELGGTRILWSALLSGEIDAYPEYTGTIRQEILAGSEAKSSELADELVRFGIGVTQPLGFNNTYALGMRRSRSEELGIRETSQLTQHPTLALRFGNEFMDRKDGWPGLRERYGLPHKNVRGLDHDLAYRGLEAGDADVIDLYTTDAEIAFYDLAVLADDKQHFPAYQAVILYRLELEQRVPTAVSALRRLEGAISEPSMIRMNAAVKLEGQAEGAVAARFLTEQFALKTEAVEDSVWSRVWRATKEHLALVGIALALSLLIALPSGIAAAKLPRFGRVILGLAGVLQTVPSLALLVVLIPVFGLGKQTAIAALVLYGLLPIVRSTFVGLTSIPIAMRESALALGMTPLSRLRRVELPLALPSILSGVQTSAVIAVGTATLGALIGAGGYGQAILTGVRLDRTSLILEGAVPSALLALAVQGLFELIERLIVPSERRG